MPKSHIVGGLDAAKFAVKGDDLAFAKTILNYYAHDNYIDGTSDGTIATHSQIEADTAAYDIYNVKPAEGDHIVLPHAADALVLYGSADVTVDADSTTALIGNAGNDTFNVAGGRDNVAVVLGNGENTVNASAGYIYVTANGHAVQHVNVTGGYVDVRGSADLVAATTGEGATLQVDSTGHTTVSAQGDQSDIRLEAGTNTVTSTAYNASFRLDGGSTTLDATDATSTSVTFNGGHAVIHEGAGYNQIYALDAGLEVFGSSDATEVYFFNLRGGYEQKGTVIIHGYDPQQDELSFQGADNFKDSGLHFSYSTGADGLEDTTLKAADGHVVAIFTDVHVDKHDLVF